MEMQETVYPKLLINMVKTAEMTGDLPSILDDMAEYYTSMEETRKQMKSAMTYPLVVLTLAFGVLIFMLTYLVPQFTAMFEENGAELPALTKAIVGLSDFIKAKWYLIIIVVVGIVGTFYFCYKKYLKLNLELNSVYNKLFENQIEGHLSMELNLNHLLNFYFYRTAHPSDRAYPIERELLFRYRYSCSVPKHHQKNGTHSPYCPQSTAAHARPPRTPAPAHCPSNSIHTENCCKGCSYRIPSVAHPVGIPCPSPC